MKKNNAFAIPQRQSQLAIIFILIRSFKRLLKQVWPLFIPLLLGGSSGSSIYSRIEIGLAGVGLLGIIPSVIAYFKYYYQLSDKELVINSGLLKKVKLNIPFERIQSVNFNQTFLHQMFDVTEVEIETAGSDSQETKIDALDMATANALRERILRLKAATRGDQAEHVEEDISEASKHSILALDIRELLKVGLVQNHLKPLGVVTGLFFTIYSYSYTLDGEIENAVRGYYQDGLNLIQGQNISSIVIVAIGALLASFLYSVISTVLKYYNLKFWRKGAKFQVVHGLLTRREYAALDNKIQILKWGQNILERWIGVYNITFAQAKSSEEKRESGSIKIPGCDKDHVQFVQQTWLGDDVSKGMVYMKVSRHMFYRTLKYLLLAFGIIITILVIQQLLLPLIAVAVLLPILIYMAWLNYKKKRFAYNEAEIYVGGGTIGLRHAILPLYKIQGVKIHENPYQWRRKLASLIVYTAGGKIVIPYIEKKQALSLMDRLLYHVELSQEAWM